MKFRLTMLALFFLSAFLSPPVFAHTDNMAASSWFFGRDNIVAVIEFGPAVLAEMEGIRGGDCLIETCSEEQLRELVTKVIQPYIDRNLSVSVNDRSYPVKVTRIDRKTPLFWQLWLSVDGVGFNNPVNAVTIDYRLLFEETDDTHINVAYLYRHDGKADAFPEVSEDDVPLAEAMFTASSRVWEFSLEGPATVLDPSRKPLWGNASEFILLGIEHILTGYDHIAFLLALIVIGLSVREALKIITAFTVAHSITLLLAALQIVSLNSRFVEIVIALSICYVALENLFRKEVNYRWLLTFGFGLIHGFGFASGLQELIEGKSDLLVSVLSFNIGVEAGQLLIFFFLLPVLYLLGRKMELRKVTVCASVAVFVFGAVWLVERVFSLKLL